MFTRLRILASRIAALFTQRRADSAFDEEVSGHLELLEEMFRAKGMSAQDAKRAARKQFGNTTLLQQQHRESRSPMFFSNLWRDTKFAARQLWKSPVFTVVCVLTLALGVGANTAVFSVMNSVLLSLLPIHDPSSVVYLKTSDRPDGTSNTGADDTSFSYPTYEALRQQRSAFSDVIVYVPMSFSNKIAVRTGETPEEAAGDMVSGNFFSGLGVPFTLGRGFAAEDETRHNAVVVISHNFWTRRFASDRDVVGKTIFIKSIPFTILGVTRAGFEGTEAGSSLDLWIPLQSRPEFNAWGASADHDKGYLQRPSWWCLRLIARLAPGVSRTQALAQAQPIFQRVAYTGVTSQSREHPPQLSFTDAKRFPDYDNQYGGPLKTLMVMVSLVLLIALTNVWMLLLARNANRQREFGIRLALGAGKLTLARQLLTESVLLVTMGGIAAWLFAIGATRALGAWAQLETSLQPDAKVLWYMLGALVLVSLFLGLAPLRSALKSRTEMVVKSSNAASGNNTQKVRTGNIVLVIQMALCVVLLVGAGLLVSTLRNLQNTSLGQRTENLLVFGVNPLKPQTQADLAAFYQSLLAQLRSLPGVLSVSLAENRPGSGWSNNNNGIVIDGHKPLGQNSTQFRENGVASDYFTTMGVPILAGRDFSDRDTPTAPKVAIVNETFARKYVGNINAVGHLVGSAFEPESQFTVIAVVKDHKYTSITEDPMPMLWLPVTQTNFSGSMNIEMRTAGDPSVMLPTLRRTLHSIDPDMPLLQPMLQSEQFQISIAQQIMFARLAGFFGLLAAVLVATGLYGTLAYRVNKRSAEIGIRIALGAGRGQVIWMILRGSLILVACGIVLGIPLAISGSQVLSSSLYGVTPLDVFSYLFAILGITVIALLASAIPARRAAGVDPLTVLRAE